MPKPRGKKKHRKSKSEYHRNRQQQPNLFKKSSFRTIPFHHSKYRGKKFKKFKKKGSGATAIIGQKKGSKKKDTIQSILIPKKE